MNMNEDWIYAELGGSDRTLFITLKDRVKVATTANSIQATSCYISYQQPIADSRPTISMVETGC